MTDQHYSRYGRPILPYETLGRYNSVWFDDLTDPIGTTGFPWDYELSGLGSPSVSNFEIDGRPGTFRLTSGTDTTSYSRALYGINAASDVQPYWSLGTDRLTFELLCRMPTLPDGTNTYTGGGGMRDYFATNSAAACGLTFSGGNLTWTMTTRTDAGALTTTTATATTATANKWHHFKLILAPSLAVFEVDGVQVCTHTTNIPDGGITPYLQIAKTAGTTSRDLDVDWVKVTQEFATRRY